MAVKVFHCLNKSKLIFGKVFPAEMRNTENVIFFIYLKYFGMAQSRGLIKLVYKR